MKQNKAFLLFGALLITINSLAQGNYSLSAYAANINGTTNLHNWAETVEKVTGKGNVKENGDKNFTLLYFNILMEVSSIKSDEGTIMTNKTYKALKGNKFPEISFFLTEPVVSIPSGVKSYTIMVRGNLTIAGITRQIVIPIKISEDGSKNISVDGAQQIKMTDYDIDPPKALFGIIKTNDVITISFKTIFSPLT